MSALQVVCFTAVDVFLIVVVWYLWARLDKTRAELKAHCDDYEHHHTHAP